MSLQARRPMAGASAVALGLGFNVPYAALAVLYDYPAVLRRPADEALAAFAEGGAPLVLAWHGFALSALALAPVAVALSVTPARMARVPGLALGAALAGAAAGIVQAAALWRWVFAVPELARIAERAPAGSAASVAAGQGFDLLNRAAGMAAGEQLGQLLTAGFVLLLALMQRGEGQPRLAGLGFATAAAIALGTGEGLAVALGGNGAGFALVTIAGFLGLSGWLAATGITLLRAAPARALVS